jgi:hypothetical protein
MRIAVWNCNMALHRKLEHLDRLSPDIAVVSESARPDIVRKKRRDDQPTGAVWVGSNLQKGLLTLARGSLQLSLDGSYDDSLREIAPVNVDGERPFRLVSVWSFNRKTDKDSRGRGPLERALDEDHPVFDAAPIVVAGDFNASAVFRRGVTGGVWRIGAALARRGLVSVYHAVHGCRFGEEPSPTIYWRDRRQDGFAYHIDYCFVPASWIQFVRGCDLGDFETWVASGLSDHVPLVVDIDVNETSSHATLDR